MLNILIFVIIFIIILYAFLAYNRSDNQEEENNINKEVLDKEEEAEDKVEQPKEEEKEQIFHFGTHYIRYKIYDDYNLSYALTAIHWTFALENLWIQEPYYSNFFRLLCFMNKFMDKNVLFIKDQNSEKYWLNVRDEDDKEIDSKAYNTISIFDIIVKVLKDNKEIILRYRREDAQQIVLSIFIYCISKSKQFKNINVEDICLIFLEDYPLKDDIIYVVSLFEKKDNPLNFVQKSFEKALEHCYKHSYAEVEKEEKKQDIKLMPKLPEKILKHIPILY